METTHMVTENMPVVSQPGNTETAATLADVIGVGAGNSEQAQNNEAAQNTVPAQEPGWYAERRQKDRAKWEAENQAKMAPVLSQMAKLQEYFIGAEADKLVASGKITDREIAMEYIRNREGVPAAPEQAAPANTPPRDEQGRFVAKNSEPDAEVRLRANMLIAQAENIRNATGVNVMELYNSDPDVRAKIVSGEWDFTNVLMQHTGAAHSAPAPVRSANGLGMGDVSISSMSAEQFARLNDYLARGGVVDARR